MQVYECNKRKDGEGIFSLLGAAGKRFGGEKAGKRVDHATFAAALNGVGSRKGAQEKKEFDVYIEKAYLNANTEWLERSPIAHIKVLRSVEFVEAFFLSHGAEEVL